MVKRERHCLLNPAPTKGKNKKVRMILRFRFRVSRGSDGAYGSLNVGVRDLNVRIS
jgi:hypothetical protein